MSATRYQLTEVNQRGHLPRRVWTERLSTANDLVYALGGRWRIERQYRDPAYGIWRRDGGREPMWEQGIAEL